jgi:hypothetical protein
VSKVVTHTNPGPPAAVEPKPAPFSVTPAQRAVLREVAEEWVRRDAEEPIRAPEGQRGSAGEAPVAAFFFERYADHGEWGVLARFLPSMDQGDVAVVLADSPEANKRRRAACVRAIGLLCQEVARLDGEAGATGAVAGGEVPT